MVVVEVEVAQQGVACKVGREAGHAGMWPGRQNTPGAAPSPVHRSYLTPRTPPVHMQGHHHHPVWHAAVRPGHAVLLRVFGSM